MGARAMPPVKRGAQKRLPDTPALREAQAREPDKSLPPALGPRPSAFTRGARGAALVLGQGPRTDALQHQDPRRRRG